MLDWWRCRTFDDAGFTVKEIAPCLPDEVFHGHKYIVHDGQGELLKILRDFTIGDMFDAGAVQLRCGF